MPYLTKPETEDESISCRIMTAGLDLFVESGYHNVSIHDVQKAAGVSIGSIYNHFGGKEGVAKGLYLHLLGELDLMVDEVLASRSCPEAQCREIIKRLFYYTETQRKIMAFMFNAKHREFLSDEPPIYCSQPFVRMRAIVSEGMQAGVFREVNPWVAAATVFGSAVRLIQWRLDGLIEQPLPELGEELITSVWSGVLPQTGAGAVRLAAAAK